jgi:Protein of unknown function (DUF805)
MALKYAVDAAAVWLVTRQLWSPLDYLVPSITLRESKLTAAPTWLVVAMVAWTLPFLWIGASMTLRRALDAGRSPWLVMLFFVPLVNYALMLVLAVLPSRPGPLISVPARRVGGCARGRGGGWRGPGRRSRGASMARAPWPACSRRLPTPPPRPISPHRPQRFRTTQARHDVATSMSPPLVAKQKRPAQRAGRFAFRSEDGEDERREGVRCEAARAPERGVRRVRRSEERSANDAAGPLSPTRRRALDEPPVELLRAHA